MKVFSPYKTLIYSILCVIICTAQTLSASDVIKSNFSIDFELSNGLIIIEASIDSKKGSYILDTGCSFLAIHGQVQSNDIQLISSEFRTGAQEVEVDYFQFGNITERQIEAVQFDMKAISDVTQRHIDGVIGTQLFSQYNIMIDYEASKVFFFSGQPDLDRSDLLNYSITKSKITRSHNQAYVNMNIAGQTMKMLLDSGANVSVVDQKWFDSLSKNQLVNTNSTLPDDFIVDESTLSHVRIKELTILYRDLANLHQDTSFDGILSLSSLNAGKIIFDMQGDQVIFFWRTDSVAGLE